MLRNTRKRGLTYAKEVVFRSLTTMCLGFYLAIMYSMYTKEAWVRGYGENTNSTAIPLFVRLL